jgi:plastocyanin
VSSHRAGRTPRHSVPAMAAMAVGLLALAGCGSSSSATSSSSSTSTPATTASTPASTSTSTPAPAAAGALSLAANAEGQLKFEPTSLTAKAGSVTINFTNTAPLAHNVTVASSSGATVGAIPTFQGGSKALTVKLSAGTYKFYCTVPGHRQAGMEGTLTVQ